MSNLHIVSVREKPAYTEAAIRYFQKHWASEDSMMVYDDCIKHCVTAIAPLPQWYLLLDGEFIYIPRVSDHKKDWCADTTTRQELLRRNQAIYEEYVSGVRMEALAEKHFLSVKSIQRIIRQQKNEQKL